MGGSGVHWVNNIYLTRTKPPMKPVFCETIVFSTPRISMNLQWREYHVLTVLFRLGDYAICTPPKYGFDDY